jgi:death on curing protein
MDRPELADLLLVAEAVLGMPAEHLARATNLPLAESALAAPYAGFGDTEFYPSPTAKAAVLAIRVTRNHALPDGNKRVGLLLMLDFIERAGLAWEAPAQEEIADVFLALAAGEMTDAAFHAWVDEHTSGPAVDPPNADTNAG